MVSTTKPGGPSPFSEEEVAAATAGPSTDPELDEVEAATIDAPDLETPFEKVVARARKLSEQQVKNVIESVLFVAPEPQSLDQLFDATGIDRERLAKGLEALQGDRREGLAGVVLHEVAGGWQLRTAPESSDFVKRFLKVKPQRLTRAALETLAICAYRQPVTRPEIEDIRGVDSGAVLKALLDRRLIKIVGKKEEVGRPILYGTTREFLEFFALKDLNALPTLREFHELTEEHQEIVEKEAPRPTAAGTVEALADPDFQRKVAEHEKASEQALEALEQAIETADTTQKAVAKVLEPPAPPQPPGAPPVPGSPPPEPPAGS
ncbi:MAG: SMC-Scp complex subunit ScpB [Myxococcaceae bacterium]|nr:SMC-Scp complex subunit ScpB [Myxococcaceae bacterium]